MNKIEVKKLTKEEFENFILMKKIEDTSLEEITELLLNQGYLVMFWQQVYEQQKEEIERLTFESTKWESKFYDEAKKVDKAIEYINWVWNNTNKPTNTIVALRTLENILQGSDKE